MDHNFSKGSLNEFFGQAYSKKLLFMEIKKTHNLSHKSKFSFFVCKENITKSNFRETQRNSFVFYDDKIFTIS